jgi:hypothetical protein
MPGLNTCGFPALLNRVDEVSGVFRGVELEFSEDVSGISANIYQETTFWKPNDC